MYVTYLVAMVCLLILATTVAFAWYRMWKGKKWGKQ